jgi:hypothetical protein
MARRKDQPMLGEYADQTRACYAEHEARIASHEARIAAGLPLFEAAPKPGVALEPPSPRRAQYDLPRGRVRAACPGARVRFTGNMVCGYQIVQQVGCTWRMLSARCLTAEAAWEDAAARLPEAA